MTRRHESGFSLLEALVAIAVIAAALAAVAQVVVAATRATRTARAVTVSVMAAREKLEWLRGHTWAFGPRGEPLGDPPLALSPPGALMQDVDGYFEVLDARGRVVAPSAGAPPAHVFVRRWSIEPLPGSHSDALVVQVRVASVHEPTADVRLVSLKPRQVR